MCSSGRPGIDAREELRREEPGVSRMDDDSPSPPLTRRVPGAARSGPATTNQPVLPDALLRRMRAAVDAARSAQKYADEAPPPFRDADADTTQPLPVVRASRPSTSTPANSTPANSTAANGAALNGAAA